MKNRWKYQPIHFAVIFLHLGTTGLLFRSAKASSEPRTVDVSGPSTTRKVNMDLETDRKFPFSCWSCNTTDDNDGCFNLTDGYRNGNHIQQCLGHEEYCRVERVWYVVGVNRTEYNFSIYRNCSAKCEPYCLIMGDRTKVYACATCCQEPLCNTGSSAESILPLTSKNLLLVSVVLLLYVVKVRQCREVVHALLP